MNGWLRIRVFGAVFFVFGFCLGLAWFWGLFWCLGLFGGFVGGGSWASLGFWGWSGYRVVEVGFGITRVLGRNGVELGVLYVSGPPGRVRE